VDVGGFLEASRLQARDASRVARRLRLPAELRVLNVHAYGFRAYDAFVRRHYGDGARRVVALSMNPGPHGAVQTGIPFCDVGMARELLPGAAALARCPSWARSERPEPSGRKLWAWAASSLGGRHALYERILFPMTVPIAILRMPARTNVPLPALPVHARREIDAFLERHAAAEVRLARPRGILLLGDYAAHVWTIVARQAPDLARLPVARVPHPAARISDAEKLGAWTRGLRRVEVGAPEAGEA
jgi:hypothetical protein